MYILVNYTFSLVSPGRKQICADQNLMSNHIKIELERISRI